MNLLEAIDPLYKNLATFPNMIRCSLTSQVLSYSYIDLIKCSLSRVLVTSPVLINKV